MTFLKDYRNSFLVSPSDRRDSWFGCERLFEMPCEMFPYVLNVYFMGNFSFLFESQEKPVSKR